MTLQQFINGSIPMSTTDQNGQYNRVTTHCVRIVSGFYKQFAIRVARSADGYRFGYNAILINEQGVHAWTKELSPKNEPFTDKWSIFSVIYDFQALKPAFDKDIYLAIEKFYW